MSDEDECQFLPILYLYNDGHTPANHVVDIVEIIRQRHSARRNHDDMQVSGDSIDRLVSVSWHDLEKFAGLRHEMLEEIKIYFVELKNFNVLDEAGFTVRPYRTPQPDIEREVLENDARLAAIRHVARLQTDERYRAYVAELEAEAASAFNGAALTMWGPHLPIAAPCLWKDRNKAAEQNPAEFIRAVYAEWLPHLSKRDLLYLDRTLYFTYAKWLGGDGKDAPCVEFGGNPRGRLDDAVYGAAMRQKNQTGIAKLRAAHRVRDESTRQP